VRDDSSLVKLPGGFGTYEYRWLSSGSWSPNWSHADYLRDRRNTAEVINCRAQGLSGRSKEGRSAAQAWTRPEIPLRSCAPRSSSSNSLPTSFRDPPPLEFPARLRFTIQRDFEGVAPACRYAAYIATVSRVSEH
jgi:hypothetical protein